MKRFMKRLHRGEKGFTLIELLIVIAILGIIAAIVVPNVAGFLISGTLNAAQTEAENVKTAAVGYLAEEGVWPDDSGDLGDFLEGGTGNLRADYTFNATAGIAAADATIAGGWDPAGTDITWNAGTQTWDRQ